MLQIRLSKGPSSDGLGGTARSVPPVETVTVACPEHLVIADLPVAKSVGAITSSAASVGRNMGRRSRRQLGDRIHFCVRCDFPIAIYGRLIPCEHAFCLACARSDPSCYLCEERVQKIQTVKMLEGIFICAAPHCLKSFLKKAEFESHVHDAHADLLQPNAEKEGGSDSNFNAARPSSLDPQKQQSSLPEASTARAPPRSGFSPGSNSQPHDREDRPHRPPSRDQPHLRPPPQVRPFPFPSSQPHQPGDIPTESNIPRVSDRPYTWFNNLQDADRAPPESAFPNFAAHQPNYPIPINPNQPLGAMPFNYSIFPSDASQSFFSPLPFEMPLRPPEGASEQGSVLGVPPAPAGMAGFRDNYPRLWGMDSHGFAVPTDSQGGMAFFRSDFSQNLMMNPLPGKESEQQGGSVSYGDGKGRAAALPGKMPLPPPPPLPPPMLQPPSIRGRLAGSGDSSREAQSTTIGWPNDMGRFGNWGE